MIERIVIAIMTWLFGPDPIDVGPRYKGQIRSGWICPPPSYGTLYERRVRPQRTLRHRRR